MNEVALKKQIDTLDSELRLVSDYYKNSLLELRSETDRLKLEIAALRAFLENAFPDFDERFSGILEKTIREVNPEFE